jgi:hypothetical protein
MAERDRIKHAREHEGSFSVGRHSEAEPKGRFSKGIEQTGETHEKTHEGSFSEGGAPAPPRGQPKGRFGEGLEASSDLTTPR